MFIQRFALTIWRASTDALSYVTDFGKRRTGSGIGYLYALSTTLAFFGLLPFAIGLAILAPSAETMANEQLAIVQRWYPDELVLTLSGGVLSTNANEPYLLDLPPEWEGIDEGGTAHIVVIDTSASIDDFDSYDTAVLLTRTSLVAMDDNGLRAYDYSDIDENFIVNEALILEGTTALAGMTPWLPWIAGGIVVLLLLVLPWILGGVLWAMNLFFLLWATLLLWVVSSIMGRGMRYGELYRLGLFGITSSLLLNFALTMVSVGVSWPAYVLFFGWMGYVLSKFPTRASTTIAPPPPAAGKTPVPVKKARAKTVKSK